MSKNDTTVNKIAKYVRQEITYSNLKSGQHLKESEIAKKFEVSRVPVREAFRILQSEGYLEVIPHRGSFVRKISKDYLKEIGVVYKLLAPVVLEAAIPKFTESTYKKANILIDKIGNCKDFNELGYLLWDFAKVIYGPSKLKFMLSLFDVMYRHNIRVLNEIFEIKQHHHYDTTDHKKFIQLCKMKKKDDAIQLWNDHIRKIEEISLKDELKK